MSDKTDEIARRLAEFMEQGNQPSQPLSPSELAVIRAIISERANASWLRKKVFTYAPHVTAFIAGAWALLGWVQAHWKGGP